MQDGIIKDILEATNGGMQIFKDLFPMVRVEGNNHVPIDTITEKQAFSVREETAPSARMRQRDGIYYFHDFGAANRDMHAINCKAWIENKELKEVIKECLMTYNINKKDETMPRAVTWEDPQPNDRKGDKSWTTKEFTQAELKVMGRNVTAEGMHFYNWELVDELREVIETKDHKLKVRIKKSEPTRPIFIRTCYFKNEDDETDCFYKIYEPKAEKAFRFKHYPEGKKPDDYIHGLWEVEKFMGQQGEKLRTLYIMSGERDAMNMNSLGEYNPETNRYENPNKCIWFNSETAHVPKRILYRLRKLANKIINVPDIDNTGEEQGVRFAKENWDIYTLKLPRYLLNIKDWRGNGMKDFRDFVYVTDDAQTETSKMVQNAHKMRFWTIEEKRDKEGNVSELRCVIDTMNVVFALNVLGYRYANVHGEDTFYIQTNHIIKKMSVQEIQRDFVGYLTAHNVEDLVVKAIINTNKFISWCKFLDSPRDAEDVSMQYMQRYYLNDGWVEIKPQSVRKNSYTNLDCDIDAEQIKNVKMGQYKPIFDFTWNEEKNDIDIEIKNTDCKLLQYLIATSMIYWKELQAEMRRLGYSANQWELPISVQHEVLTDEQNQEQLLSFENKMFVLGYLLSSFKDAAKPWAVYIMDNKVSDVNESNGGSGKSLLFQFCCILLKRYFINGKMKKLADNAHLYDGVDETVKLIQFDDLDKRFNVEMLFSDITSDLYVNPKGKTPYTIPFKKSAKFGITTNYVPMNIDASVKRRLRFATCSDWFHVKTSTNGYENDYTPKQMFGQTLIDDFDDKDMSETLACLFDCVRYYMLCTQHGMIKDCILRNIEIRQLMATVGPEFIEWFRVYFDKENGHLNMMVTKSEAYMDYRASCSTPVGRYVFSRKLKEYCKQVRYTYNPEEYCNTPDGRIIKREGVNTVEKIYISDTEMPH